MLCTLQYKTLKYCRYNDTFGAWIYENDAMNTFRQRNYPLRPAWPAGQAPGLFVSHLGFFESTGDFLWENFSSMFCLHVIRRGAGVFDVDGTRHEARPGSVFLFHPGMHIVYYDSPRTPWHYTWLRFDGSDADWAFDRVGLDRRHPHRDISGNARFFQTLDDLCEVFPANSGGELYPVTAAWQLIEALGKDRTITPDSTGLAEACRLVLESQLETAPSVDDLAGRFNVNRSTLFRAFREQFHVSPKEYIDLLRFEKACGLLQRTDQSIKQVAAACGFRSPDYFSAAFRKRFGAAPTVWRRQSDSRP